ncbi:MarR family winged helix-turn-helix transcriptional regulator [Methylopila henanensis]|uniref:MarR family winged helix-turn-helix transcriptional regulator n=1 Tax=Methylopila henanensis TaxID=873516 RepID=A0ABW4KAP9_9HYPH
MNASSSPATAVELGYDLAVAARRWRRMLDETLSRYDLSDASWRPLLHLDRIGDGARQSDLAQSLGIEGPSLVRLLDRLAAAGLLERREDPSDRRAKTLHLTDAGLAAVARLRTVVAAACADMLEGVTEDEIAVCRRVLARVAERAGR